MTLAELKSRLDAATGADRELDGAIRKLFKGCSRTQPKLLSFDGDVSIYTCPECGDTSGNHGVNVRLGRYTSSIDAALALVAEKLPDFNCWSIEYTRKSKGVFVEASVSKNYLPSGTDRKEWKMFTGEAPTAPLAILRALVAAMEGYDGRL